MVFAVGYFRIKNSWLIYNLDTSPTMFAIKFNNIIPWTKDCLSWIINLKLAWACNQEKLDDWLKTLETYRCKFSWFFLIIFVGKLRVDERMVEPKASRLFL